MKMKVYSLQHKTLQSPKVIWKDLIHIKDDVIMHLVEGTVGDVIEISIGEMTEEEYENLPEFEGY